MTIKKILKYGVYTLFAVLVIIQFIKPERNVGGATENDISKGFPVPDNVKVVLETACNDCHTNKTEYPWYANIQPVAWMLAEHVEDGKKHLNFNEFMSYKPKRQYHKLEEIDEMLMENEMPLASYTWIHKDAKLSEDQKALLIKWSKDLRDSLSKMHPELTMEEEDD